MATFRLTSSVLYCDLWPLTAALDSWSAVSLFRFSLPLCLICLSSVLGAAFPEFNAFLHRTQGQQYSFYLSDIRHVWCAGMRGGVHQGAMHVLMHAVTWGTYSAWESENQNQRKRFCMRPSCFVLRNSSLMQVQQDLHTHHFSWLNFKNASKLHPNAAVWGFFTQTSNCVFL